jgi:curved DNA-binding protein
MRRPNCCNRVQWSAAGVSNSARLVSIPPGDGAVSIHEAGADAVSESRFVDHYEVLQLSPNATAETVERVYRILAKRYHPDNQETGDAAQFQAIHTAYELLANPESRASYDVKYDENRAIAWKIFKQDGADEGRSDDRRLFHGILSLLYIARRRDPSHGGLGPVTLETMLGCPRQHLEFPLWYLRQRGYIERLDSGYIAITVDGVDKLGSDDLSLPANRLLPASSEEAPAAEGSLLLETATAS